MASPYTIRSRNLVSSPIPNGNLFKTFETTPKLPSKRLFLFENNKYQKMTAVKSGDEQTPPNHKTKAQIFNKHLSLHQPSNFDQPSNQFNESSVVPQRGRSDLQLERSSQNINYKQQDKGYLSYHALGLKQMDHHTDKNSADDEIWKDKKKARKQKSWSCHGVPYRKCHSSMQEKVVSIINKIKSGKYCQKQIQTLIEKSKKISIKELNNKYFVSGIQLISNLSLQKQFKSIFTPQLITRLSEALEDLKNRILSQLDNIKGFQMKGSICEEITFQKIELVRRAYRILRKKLKNLKRQQVQNKALEAADWFLENKVNNLYLFYEELAQS